MMLNLRRRLKKLEESPLFQPATAPIDPTSGLALGQISDADLLVLMALKGDPEAGVCRTASESELAALAAYQAALDLS